MKAGQEHFLGYQDKAKTDEVEVDHVLKELSPSSESRLN